MKMLFFFFRFIFAYKIISILLFYPPSIILYGMVENISYTNEMKSEMKANFTYLTQMDDMWR